jgi:hypothetical protein
MRTEDNYIVHSHRLFPKYAIMNKAVKVYKKTKKENQKAKLEQFNKEMGDKIKALQFSKPIKVDTNTIDEDFAVLARNEVDL